MGKFGMEFFSEHMQQLILHQYSNGSSEAIPCNNHLEQISGFCNEEYLLYQQLSRLHSVCKVSVLIAVNSCHIPSLIGQLSTLLTIDCQSYLVKGLTLDMLASYTFSQCFTSTGEVQALSAGTRIDVDDCAMLSPSGRLSLLLSANTYQQLGLVGQLGNNILRAPKHRYAVHVNTLLPSFHPHRPGYDKTLSRLRTLKMNFTISWRPHKDVAACPSSIARYFVDLGLDVEQVKESVKEGWSLKNVLIPTEKWINEEVCAFANETFKRSPEQGCQPGDDKDDKARELSTGNNTHSAALETLIPQRQTGYSPVASADHGLDAADFLEAIGCFLLKITPSTFEGEQETVERMHVMQSEAYYSSTHLKHALHKARQWLLSSEGADAPWCCLCFHAHPEVPFETVHDGCAKLMKSRDKGTVEMEQCSFNTLVDPSNGNESKNSYPAYLIQDKSNISPCNILQCGCGMVEADQHVVSGRMSIVIVRRKDFLCYSYGSACVRHRYYSKSSNNK